MLRLRLNERMGNLIKVASEHQFDLEPGKDLELAVVSIVRVKKIGEIH